MHISSRRLTTAAIAVAAPVVAIALAWTLVPAPGGNPPENAPAAPAEARSAPKLAGADRTEGAAGMPVDGVRSYAVLLPRLQGLPPDAPPGTRMELWVSWEPPVTEEPEFQRLLDEVVLERIIPPHAAEAPATAVLLVPEEEVGDLLYGDRYGTLSVTLHP